MRPTLPGRVHAGAMRLAEAGLRLRAAAGDADWRERLVLDRPGPAPAAVWVHAASVGEVNSAAAVIAALAAAPGVIVTANTPTGRDRARALGWPARLAPLDAPGATARFLEAVQPRAMLVIEGEFWPVRARMLAARGLPQAMAGARISARSAARWARLGGLIRPVLGQIAALSAQDAGSEARLLALGLRPEALLPRLDLKLIAPASIRPASPAPAPKRDRCWLAASTHQGEEEPILDAFAAARARMPDLRLILAPRHPARGDEVAALIAARGLPFARRSAGAGSPEPLLLADTLGEMDRWYAAAGLCLTGGSLTDRGGHTPWEPAGHGCAILHGPHVANFADSYARLDAAGAALSVEAATLAETVAALATDPGRARAMGAAARAVLDRDAGDPAALVAAIRALAQRGPRADIMGHDPL